MRQDHAKDGILFTPNDQMVVMIMWHLAEGTSTLKPA